jgi:hypothetical protein
VFRNFAIALDLKQDQWVKAVEFRPSANASHHALFFLDQTGQALKLDAADPRPGFTGMNFLSSDPNAAGDDRRGGRGGLGQRGQAIERRLAGASLGGWAVGGTPSALPEGLARPVPEGSDLVLQMHFHPTGKPEREQATVGLYFADAPPKRTLTGLQLPPLFGALAGIDIPAGEKRFIIKDTFTLPIDAEVISAGAHAHYLATDMRLTATAPGGRTQDLFRIPDWRFNWQERYYFREPVRLPKGTRIDVEIAYDNSSGNPSNPSVPPKRVRFGQQSSDEMGSVTIEFIPVNERDLPQYAAEVRRHLQRSVVNRVLDGGGRGRRR